MRSSAEALLAEDSRGRELIRDYPAFVREIRGLLADTSPESLLRLYWYDAAAHDTPAFEHSDLAAMPGVRLRLGRIVGEGGRRRQKEVDGLLIADLLGLARDRAVQTVHLLAGDGDLTPGVIAAEDLGLRVVLLQMPKVAGSRVSNRLLSEVDDLVVVSEEIVRSCFIVPTGFAETWSSLAPTRSGALLVGVRLAAAWLELATRAESDAAFERCEGLVEDQRTRLREKLVEQMDPRGDGLNEALFRALEDGFATKVRVASLDQSPYRDSRAPQAVLDGARLLGAAMARDATDAPTGSSTDQRMMEDELRRMAAVALSPYHVCEGVLEAMRTGLQDAVAEAAKVEDSD